MGPTMLDLACLHRIRLSPIPRAQYWFAKMFLWPNFSLPPRVRIDVEGYENVPKAPVIYAMNHTDRYNYWPFQYELRHLANRYTATWIKGKYYENKWVAGFVERTNNLPTVSRGYLITKDFLNILGRKPSNEEYHLLRELINGYAFDQNVSALKKDELPAELFTQSRDMLGYGFDPANEDYASAINKLYAKMMKRFVQLNKEVFEQGLDLLVFPQGTRSIRLTPGHIGIAQIALYFQRAIVPVGCNGSQRVYPGVSPWAKGGHIVYRIGKPITLSKLAAFQPAGPFEPFTPRAETTYREQFQGLVDHLMGRINELVDEPYRFAEQGEEAKKSAASRFI